MPRPKRKYAKTQNSEGKKFTWADPEKDVAQYKSMKYLGNFANPLGLIYGQKDPTADEINEIENELVEDNQLTEDEVKGYFGGGIGKRSGKPSISIGADMQQDVSCYITSDIQGRIDEIREDYKKVCEKASSTLRNKYKDKIDATSRHYQRAANIYADTIDAGSNALDYTNGDILKAEFDSPSLHTLNNAYIDFPQFEYFGFEEVVDGMGPIYEDYMMTTNAGFRETNVQFHRQQMEETGWDADKEKTYLNELRLEHKKTVDAFDRLWNTPNKGQYDKFLGNPLDALLGKERNHNRDQNNAMGYMRGEIQAIDMGYDSRHLHTLGIVGVQEQMLKKYEAQIADDMRKANGNEEELAPLREQLNNITEYRKDFDSFRDSVWNKRVNSKEEMEATDETVNKFFEAHNEKFKRIQRVAFDDYKRRLDYAREEGKEFGPVPTPALNDKEVGLLLHLNDLVVNLGEESFPDLGGEIMMTISKGPAGTYREGPNKGQLMEDYDKEVKDFAGKAQQKLDDYTKRDKDPSHPRGEAFRDALAEYGKYEMQCLKDGYALGGDQNNPNKDYAFKAMSSVMPQLSVDIFKPENADKLEEALNEYPLDTFMEKALEIQKMKTDFRKREGGMTQSEKDTFNAAMREKQEDMLDLAVDLKSKSKDPSDKTLALFGKKEYLTDDFQFSGKRGLGALIDSYNTEFGRTNIPSELTDKLSASYEKFNAKPRSIFAGKESPEHAALRETADKVKENLDKLNKGMVMGENGKERAMTSDEKLALIGDTMNTLNDMSTQTDTYVGKRGRDKGRLEGAKEFKNIINGLQVALMKAEQAEAKNMAAKVTRKDMENKAPAKERISLKDLKDEDLKAEGKETKKDDKTKKVTINKDKDKKNDLSM